MKKLIFIIVIAILAVTYLSGETVKIGSNIVPIWMGAAVSFTSGLVLGRVYALLHKGEPVVW